MFDRDLPSRGKRVGQAQLDPARNRSFVHCGCKFQTRFFSIGMQFPSKPPDHFRADSANSPREKSLPQRVALSGRSISDEK